MDIDAIEKEILQTDINTISKIEASGDTHRKCKRVLIIWGFNANKQPVKFIYKPRSISNEVLFAHICHWYNKNTQTVTLRTPIIIDCGSRGYSEFISYKTCKNDKDLDYFYSSLGQLTALLYVVNGMDIHHENIIAHGKYPILIDLECILTPVIEANKNTYRNIGQSLILPRQENINKDNKGINLSAMSDAVNQKLCRKTSIWHAPGTDEMHLEREDIEFKIHGNTPRIEGKKSKPINCFKQSFANGFTTAYQLMLRSRDFLLSERSPFFQLENIYTRYLFRSTSDYSLLLLESYHPLLLTDFSTYRKHIDWLNEIEPYHPHYKHIVPSEKKDLERGDIPYFECQTNTSSILDSSGSNINLAITKNGTEQCQTMLHLLSEKDLTNQLELIELSFTAYEWNKMSIAKLMDIRSSQTNTMEPPAHDLIKQLAHTSIIGDDYVAWPQLSFDQHQSFVSDLTGISFYNGTLGIAFALAHWDHYFDCDQSRQLVNHILNNCISICQKHPAVGFGLSGYSGLLYGAHHIAKCNYPAASKLANLLANNAGKTPFHHDNIFDVMSGISLDITTMLYFFPSYNINEDKIYLYMNHLKNNCPDPKTFGHNINSVFSNGDAHPPNLGYAHGITGIAIAFSRYAKRYNDDFCFQWVQQTLNLLEEYLQPNGSYWPDMRKAIDYDGLSDIVARPPAWCGGHVGIGLFYLECYLQWPALEEQALKGLHYSVKLSMASVNNSRHLANLCCGFYGDLDFLHCVNQSLTHINFPDMDGTLDKLATLLRSCALESNYTGLFHGIPSYLYLSLRHQFPNSMPTALYW